MNLVEATTVFERAAAANTPFPVWASIEEALSVIESDEDFSKYFALHHLVVESPSWELIKQGCTGKSFAEVVKSAAALLTVLQQYHVREDFSVSTAAEAAVNF